MSQALSEQDVAALLSHVSAPVAAATRLGTKFAQGSLSTAERLVAEEVLRGMLNGAVIKVRQAIADTLKDSGHLPHDIAVALANDVESVAIPILQFSLVLSDEDLVEIIQAGNPQKQIAVAGRPVVSEKVAGELLQTDNVTAVATLVGNAGANLTQTHLTLAADKFGADVRVTERLQQRAGLPIAVAERLVAFTMDKLRDFIMRRVDLSENIVTQLVLRTREQITVDLRSTHFPAEEAVELVQHLHSVKRLTPSLLLRALCVGDVSLFEAGMAQLAGIAMHNAQLLIHDAGNLGFKSLYDRANLPAAMFMAFQVALQVSRETDFDGLPHDRDRYSRQMIERILTQFEGLGADDLDYLMIRLSGTTLPATADS